jgi:uncharacterized protein YggE
MRAALACLLLMAATVPFARAEAQEAPPPSRIPVAVPGITVQGTGEVRADPDEATVRLGVVGQAPSARAAQEKVNQVANAVLAAVGGLGVVAADIQTSELNLSPIYTQARPDAPAQNPERISGYSASNVVSVRLSKLDLVGRVIDAGLGAGANQVEGVSFGLRNDQAARARALSGAVAEARGKAQAIVGALGVRLGEVLEVAEGEIGTVSRFVPKMMSMAMADRSSATPVAAGQLTVSASVTIRYRILQ